MIKLLNQLKASELSDNQRFIKSESYWKVLQNTYLDGVFLYKDDEIRLEKVSYLDLKTAAILLREHLKQENRSITFYHLADEVIDDRTDDQCDHKKNNKRDYDPCGLTFY